MDSLSMEAWLHRRSRELAAVFHGSLWAGLLCFLGPFTVIPVAVIAASTSSMARTSPEPRMRRLLGTSGACALLYLLVLLGMSFVDSGPGASKPAVVLAEIGFYALLVSALVGISTFSIAMRSVAREAGYAQLAGRWKQPLCWSLGVLGAVVLAILLEPWTRDRGEHGFANPEQLPLLLLAYPAWGMLLTSLGALRSRIRRTEHMAWTRAGTASTSQRPT
jgi:hypothetical protein